MQSLNRREKTKIDEDRHERKTKFSRFSQSRFDYPHDAACTIAARESNFRVKGDNNDEA
jgi:hypothetical protein